MIDMVKNILNKEVEDLIMAQIVNISHSMEISEMQMIYSKNFLEEKILLQIFLMMMMISLETVVSDILVEECKWDMDLEEWVDSVKWINNKKNTQPKIHSQISAWWEEDLMMMMIFLEMEVLEVDSEEVQDFNHFKQVVLVAWEEEWENLLANKQLLKMDVKKL